MCFPSSLAASAMAPRWRRAAALVLAVLSSSAFLAVADEEAEEAEAPGAGAAEAGTDETSNLLKELTISMVSDVVDAHSFVVHDTAAKGRKKLIMRLGNVATLKQAANVDDEQYAAKREGAKAALEKMVAKQMIWWKAAPDAVQPPQTGENPLIVDAWNIDGKHINGWLRKQGHLSSVEEYSHDLNKDILTAAADQEKKDSYKKLEEAMREQSKAAKEAALLMTAAEKVAEKAAKEEADASMGFGGYVALVIVAILGVGVMTNFGRGNDKKKLAKHKPKGAKGS